MNKIDIARYQLALRHIKFLESSRNIDRMGFFVLGMFTTVLVYLCLV